MPLFHTRNFGPYLSLATRLRKPFLPPTSPTYHVVLETVTAVVCHQVHTCRSVLTGAGCTLINLQFAVPTEVASITQTEVVVKRVLGKMNI